MLLESRSPKRHAVRRDILDIYFGVKHVAEAQPTTQSAFEMQASFLALLQQGVDIVTAKATSVIDDRDRVIQKLTKTVEVQELLHLDPIRRQTEERSAVQLGAAMEVLSGGKIPHLTGESVNTLLMACGVLSRNRKPGYWEYTVTEEGEKLGRKVIMQSGKSYGPSTYNCVQWNNAVVPVLVNFYVQQGLTPDRLKAMTAEARHGGR